MIFQGLDGREIAKLMCEYKNMCDAYDVDKKGWITFKEYMALRTGIGLEKEMKLFKVKQRIDDIEEDFKDE